jgi:hypothetical protein
MTFVIKAGTVAVLVDAERLAPLVERPPLRVETVPAGGTSRSNGLPKAASDSGSASSGSASCCSGLRPDRGGYLMAVVAAYRWADAVGLAWAGTALAALTSTVLVVWITVVNLLYLVVQIMVVARDTSVARRRGRCQG